MSAQWSGASGTRVVPDRRWIATLTRADGVSFTTVIYGRTASEAELRAEAEQSGVVLAIVRREAD